MCLPCIYTGFRMDSHIWAMADRIVATNRRKTWCSRSFLKKTFQIFQFYNFSTEVVKRTEWCSGKGRAAWWGELCTFNYRIGRGWRDLCPAYTFLQTLSSCQKLYFFAPHFESMVSTPPGHPPSPRPIQVTTYPSRSPSLPPTHSGHSLPPRSPSLPPTHSGHSLPLQVTLPPPDPFRSLPTPPGHPPPPPIQVTP